MCHGYGWDERTAEHSIEAEDEEETSEPDFLDAESDTEVEILTDGGDEE